jgi:hypothetical protein
MLKSDLRPLAPYRQRLSSIDPSLAAAAKVAFEVGVGTAGSLISAWVWSRYIASKRKAKTSVKTSHLSESQRGIYIHLETIEERIIRTKKIRVVMKVRL